MSLRVNLILDSETRSGSAVSLKFALLGVSFAVAAALLLAVGGLFLASHVTRQNLQFAQQEKQRLEPVYRATVNLQQQLREQRRLAEMLDGWARSRIDWPLILRRLQAAVPPSIQFTRLTVNENIELLSGAPTRVASLHFKGLAAGGSRAEDDVRRLDRILQEDKFFKEIFAKTGVLRFEAAEEPAARDIRVFEIECLLVPKTIGQ